MSKESKVEEALLEYVEKYGMTDKAREWFKSSSERENDDARALPTAQLEG